MYFLLNIYNFIYNDGQNNTRVRKTYKDNFVKYIKHRVIQKYIQTTAGTVTASRTETTFPSWVASSATQHEREVGLVHDVVEIERVVGFELALVCLTIWKRTSGLTTDVDWRFACQFEDTKASVTEAENFESWHQNVVVLSSASWINFDYKFA